MSDVSLSVSEAAALEFRIQLNIVNRVAVLTLNRPEALNALSHAMVRELTTHVERCRVDPDIVAIVLKGAGQKGFCAGGDVRELHDARRRGDKAWQQFFIDEYRLDFALHTFPKPVVALLDGITMGGGMGLGQAARLRVVTERTKIAMPETRIGLLPDVGATRFLSRMPVAHELYVGLTGVTLSGSDALRLGLADAYVPSDWLYIFEERLARIDTAHLTDELLMHALHTVFELPCRLVIPPGIDEFRRLITHHFNRRFRIDDIVGTLHQALAQEQSADTRHWLQTAYAAMTSNSPTMLHVTREALLRGRRMSLAECFRMELGIVARAIEEGDFCEGVRAHLLDKDRSPRWNPATPAEVQPECVARFLASPWEEGAHPLADLSA